MNLLSPREHGNRPETAENQVELTPPSRLISRLVIPVGGLVLMASLLVYVLHFTDPEEDPQRIPVIKAEAGPTRVKPDNPGGEEVPHQDKLVYERLGSRAPVNHEAHLLPLPEDPLERLDEMDTTQTSSSSEMPALEGTKTMPPVLTSTKQVPLSEESPVEVIDSSSGNFIKEKIKEDPIVVLENTAQNASSLGDAKKSFPTAKKMTAQKIIGSLKKDIPSVKIGPSAVKTVSQSGYRLQLASSFSQELMHREWERLIKLCAGLLGAFKPVINAEKTSKGETVYTLRIGPLKENIAKKLVQQLHEKKVSARLLPPHPRPLK